MNFKDLNIIPPIMKAVTQAGYTKATEIQYQTIPHILNGNDVIGCAQTGTGKTASFAIPVLQLLDQNPAEKKRYSYIDSNAYKRVGNTDQRKL